MPVLEGERVRLEPLSQAHSRGMFELWRDPRVCEHAGPAVDSSGRAIDLPAASRAESDRLLQFWLDRSSAGTGFRWAVVRSGEEDFIGAVGFNVLGACAEYAYHFVPRSWGAGLATEASRLALSWCFASGSESIEAFIEPANAMSIRLAVRLGFERSEQGSGEVARYVRTRGSHAG